MLARASYIARFANVFLTGMVFFNLCHQFVLLLFGYFEWSSRLRVFVFLLRGLLCTGK